MPNSARATLAPCSDSLVLALAAAVALLPQSLGNAAHEPWLRSPRHAASRKQFTGPTFDPRLPWLNPPPSSSLGPNGPQPRTSAGSDFWQRTHYGFHSTGHALLLRFLGFSAGDRAHVRTAAQYDQAGLFVLLSGAVGSDLDRVRRRCAQPLGSVVTNGGWSELATQDVALPCGAPRMNLASRGRLPVEHQPRPAFPPISGLSLSEDAAERLCGRAVRLLAEGRRLR